jgi:LPXTG-site transpeptidase (sortase) family protein
LIGHDLAAIRIQQLGQRVSMRIIVKTLSLVILLAAAMLGGLYAWVALRPPAMADMNGAYLMRAHWLALHPTKRVVHRGEILGIIQVPRLGLAVPFVEGTDDDSLDSGAGHIPHTAFPGHHGNAGIAAHRDTCFRPLRFIRASDHIVVTTPEGAYDYVVTGSEIVLPSDGKVLHHTSAHSLTLVTCYPFFYIGSAPQRFVVHAAEPQSGAVS